MAKLLIHVPDELKARMDAVDKPANWSAIAQQAWVAHLLHMEESLGKKTSLMDLPIYFPLEGKTTKRTP
jgi:hypothetical protein